MRKIGLVFFEGISFVSKIIRKVTSSRFSHVAYVKSFKEDGKTPKIIIECWSGDSKVIPIDYILINRFNKKYSWKYSKLSNHTPGTKYTVLTYHVPEEVYYLIDSMFEFFADYRINYDLLGLLGRLSKKFDSKSGFYCSEGVQDILKFANKKFIDILEYDITDLSIPGYKTDPGMLYNILLLKDWKVEFESQT